MATTRARRPKVDNANGVVTFPGAIYARRVHLAGGYQGIILTIFPRAVSDTKDPGVMVDRYNGGEADKAYVEINFQIYKEPPLGDTFDFCLIN